MIRTANLTLTLSRNAGGLFDAVRRLVQSLASTGLDATVYAARDEFSNADIPAWAPVPVRVFPATGPPQFGYSPGILKELRAYRPDLTHTHGIWSYSSVATRRYCAKTRTPYIISPHGMLDGWAVRNSRLKKRIAHFLYEGAHLRGARCLRALCEAEARAIRDLGLRNDIAIIPNGVDLPDGPPDAAVPWSGFLAPGRKVLLYLGRIHPKKGIASLVAAWGATPIPQAAGWVLAIAGWDQGGHEQELKQLADRSSIPWTDVRAGSPSRPSTSGAPPSLIFLGPQFGGAKAASYCYCDAFVLPSLSEGVPMTVLEAWVNSKPVLMTPQCNLPEGFAAAAAIEAEPAVKSLTDGLIELCRLTDQERVEMGGRGCQLAVRRFVWPRVADQMKEVYEWMLGGGARPACMADF